MSACIEIRLDIAERPEVYYQRGQAGRFIGRSRNSPCRRKSKFLSEKDGETDKLWVRIQQEGATFVFPLWIEWKIGGRKFREMVVVDSASREFKIPLSGRPSSVRINPDHAVPGHFKMLKTRPGKASPKIEEPQERTTASVARLRKPIAFSNHLSNKRNFGVGYKEES